MVKSRFFCNGYGGGVAMSREAILLMASVLPQVRAEFKALHPEAARSAYASVNRYGLFCGARFDDNDSVAARIENVTDEADFMAHPVEWVRAALLDCAEADHWYTFEKDHGY